MNRKILRSLLILDVMIAGAALVFVLVSLWNRPLGPALGLLTAAAKQTVISSSLSAGSKDSVSTLDPTSAPSSLLSRIMSVIKPKASTNDTLCNGPSVMTLLLVGSDGRSEDYLYGLADSIHIVRIDFATPNVMVLDIPRDLWVEIPGISDHYGVTHGKLNQAYFFGNPGMGYYDGPGEGPGLLARTLEQNFGLSVDHYLAVDMNTFVRVVDAVDGIDVNLDSTVDFNQNHDGENPALVLGPGIHHLDGQTALLLARDRYPSIYQRARYQNIVLRAIQDKLLTPAMLPKLPQLISQFAQSVQTDLSPNDISKLVCISKSLTKDNTSMPAFPEDMFSSGHIYDPYRQVYTYVIETDFNKIRSYLADFSNGTWPK